jgi:hypothetical protein
MMVWEWLVGGFVVCAVVVTVGVVAGYVLDQAGIRRRRDLEALSGVLERLAAESATTIRASLGYVPDGGAGVPPGPVFTEYAPESLRVPANEMVPGDPWSDALEEEPQLTQMPDGSFMGWDEVGIPTPPGENGA